MRSLLPWVLSAQLSVSFAASSALAQPVPQVVEGDAQAYQSAVRAAVSEYDLGNFQEALALFERAHALSPNARTLRGAGMSAFAMRKYVLAMRYLNESLTSESKPLTDAMRSEVQDLIARAETFVVTYRLDVQPAQVTVQVDGQAVEVADGVLLLDPGEHEIVVSADGHEPVTRRVRAEPGGQGRLRLVLAAHTRDAQKPSFFAERKWTWVALGGVPLFGASALTLWFQANRELDEVVEGCRKLPAGGCTDRERDRRIEKRPIATYELATNVSIGLAGASLAATAVLLWWENPRRSPERPVNVSLTPTGAVVSGRF
jgi:tetratricopeptide (TPR) repeat protein